MDEPSPRTWWPFTSDELQVALGIYGFVATTLAFTGLEPKVLAWSSVAFVAAFSLAGLLVHAHEVGRVVHGDPLGVVPHLREGLIDQRAITYQQRVNVRRVERELRRAADDLQRAVIAPHHVEGDGDRPLAHAAYSFFLLAESRSMQPLVRVYWYVPSSSRQYSPTYGQ